MEGIRSFAQEALAAGLDLSELRANSVLRKDEWKSFDDRVIGIARDRVSLADDLRNAGLVRNVGGLGVLVDEWETSSDMTKPKIDLAAVTDSDEDAIEFRLHGVPIPIIHKGFRLNLRRVLAARQHGTPLDTIQAEVSTRQVLDEFENMCFAGVPNLQVDGYSIYGIYTHPDRNTTTVTAAWSNQLAAYNTVIKMIDIAQADNHFGPYNLYLNATEWNELRKPEGTDNFISAFQRIMEIPEINAIRVSQSATAGTVSLVQMTSDVIDLVIAQDLQMVDWESKGGLVQHFKLLLGAVPRIKSDDDGKSGIVIATGA